MKRLALALLLALGPPAQAAIPLPEPAEEVAQPAAAEPRIDDRQEAGADERIRARLADIFDALPALSGVEVTVDGGVVGLAGTVPKEADIERAGSIAERIDGVVTVENALERDVSVGRNLSVIEDARSFAVDFVRMLPLIGLALLVALLIAGIGYAIASLSGLWRRVAPNGFLAGLIATAIRFVFIVGGIVVALDMLGAGALLGAVLGGAGVIGLALGFALRDTIENYVASVMLSLRQPFRANDWVLIDEHEGRVIRLTSRATVMMTLDGNHLRIPNGTVFKAVILNYTRNPQRRFEFDLGIDADDDPDAARALGRARLAELDFVLDDPSPEARTIEVGDSNIVIRFLGWIDQREADWFKAKSRAIAVVKAALEGGGLRAARADLPPALRQPNRRAALRAGRRRGRGCGRDAVAVAAGGTPPRHSGRGPRRRAARGGGADGRGRTRRRGGGGGPARSPPPGGVTNSKNQSCVPSPGLGEFFWRSIASITTRRASAAEPHSPTRTHFSFSRSL